MPRKESESSHCEDSQDRTAKQFKKSEKVLTWFIDYMYQSIRSPDIKLDPFDTMIIKAHYNFTAHLLFTLFMFVTSHWLVEEPIVCVDQHDKSEAPEDMLELCITYPYVEYPHNNDRNNMKRRYALYYKWVHIVCLILSFVYKGVLVPRKIFHFKKHRKMLEDITEAKLQDRFGIAKRYFLSYKGCHNNMYVRFLYVHISAFIVNLICFFALNITFQNYYWDLPKNLLYKRDPQRFHDAFSLIFPPFSECEITAVHHILVDRSKWFGCHLTLMEFYEKIFMIFWFWQVFLGIWTLAFVFCNLPFTFWFKWKLNLLNSSRFNKYEPYAMCAKHLTKDDSFALRAVASVLIGSDYAKLISLMNQVKNEKPISDPNETVYFETASFNNDSNKKDNDLSNYQSCLKDSNEDIHAPIGFEHLEQTPDFHSNFDPISNSTAFLDSNEKNPLNRSFKHWKRSLSLEFDEDIILRRATNLDAKVTPLLQYLQHSKIDSSEDSDISIVTPESGKNIMNSISSTKKYLEKYADGPKKCSAPEYEGDSECTIPVEDTKSNFPRHVGNNYYMYDRKEATRNTRPFTKNINVSSTKTDSSTKSSKTTNKKSTKSVDKPYKYSERSKVSEEENWDED